MFTTNDYTAQPAVPADQRIAYGKAADQFGDLYLPDGAGSHPVAILLHGGCWRAQYGLAPLGPLCDALRSTGVAVWSLEYRRVGGGGGWPDTMLDVAAGAAFLKFLAPSFSLDLSRLITIGHSAGGHLALWLAAGSRRDQGDLPPVTGVVALAALADLAEANRRGLCDTAVAELLGGDHDAVPDRYQTTSPSALLPLGVPQRHIVGAHDPIVPPDYLAAYVAQARAAGDDATLLTLPNAGHFEPVMPQDDVAWAAVRGAVLDLLV